MKRIVFKGQSGVFFSDEEYEQLVSKITEQRDLISDLGKKMKQ